MRTYNFIKAKELIEKNKTNLESASLGMHEDWFWTAETIFEEGEYKMDLPDNADEIYKKYENTRMRVKSIFSKALRKYDSIMIGGVYGSDWATPTLNLIFKNGEEKMIPCYNGDKEREDAGFPILGVLSAPVQENITPLES